MDLIAELLEKLATADGIGIRRGKSEWIHRFHGTEREELIAALAVYGMKDVEPASDGHTQRKETAS
jgi:hypothetical protein